MFRDEFTGGAKSPGQWLRLEVPRTLRRLRLPVALMAGLLVAGAWLGVDQVSKLGITPEAFNLGEAAVAG